MTSVSLDPWDGSVNFLAVSSLPSLLPPAQNAASLWNSAPPACSVSSSWRPLLCRCEDVDAPRGFLSPCWALLEKNLVPALGL